MALPAGTRLGTYEILATIGEGGMGQVYRALDTMLEREVALKSLKQDIASQSGVVERFRREAMVLARLSHPAIAQLYSFFEDESDSYMVMEYVAGETLETRISRDGALRWEVAFGYAAQILEGIGHAHALGVLHRDLKPANIMVTPAGKIKIMDFGIARALDAARLTRQDSIIGTLEYLAPERIEGKEADARSDLYSAGTVLYEMVTGRLPFQCDTEGELLMAHMRRRPPAPRELGVDLPPAVEKILLRALEKNPARRYGDAVEFSDAIAELLPQRTRGFGQAEPALKETRLAVPLPPRRLTAASALARRTSKLAAALAQAGKQFGSEAIRFRRSNFARGKPLQKLYETLPPPLRTEGGLMALVALITLVAVLLAYVIFAKLTS